MPVGKSSSEKSIEASVLLNTSKIVSNSKLQTLYKQFKDFHIVTKSKTKIINVKMNMYAYH